MEMHKIEYKLSQGSFKSLGWCLSTQYNRARAHKLNQYLRSNKIFHDYKVSNLIFSIIL